MTRSSRSVLLPLLIAAVLGQSVVSLVPHRHEVETVHTAATLAVPGCTHGTPDVVPLAEVTGAPSCLACMIPTPAFHHTIGAPFNVVTTSTFAWQAPSDRRSDLPRRWRQQLRAPPYLA